MRIGAKCWARPRSDISAGAHLAEVCEAAIVATHDAESVFPSEVSAEILVGNTAGVAIAGVALRWLHIIVRIALRLPEAMALIRRSSDCPSKA